MGVDGGALFDNVADVSANLSTVPPSTPIPDPSPLKGEGSAS